MTLKRITLSLPAKAANLYGDDTLTFDLPAAAIKRLAEHGLRVMAADSATVATYSGGDPFDILWEKLDALSKD